MESEIRENHQVFRRVQLYPLAAPRYPNDPILYVAKVRDGIRDPAFPKSGYSDSPSRSCPLGQSYLWCRRWRKQPRLPLQDRNLKPKSGPEHVVIAFVAAFYSKLPANRAGKRIPRQNPQGPGSPHRGRLRPRPVLCRSHHGRSRRRRGCRKSTGASRESTLSTFGAVRSRSPSCPM